MNCQGKKAHIKQLDGLLRYYAEAFLADIPGPNYKGNENKTNAADNVNETFFNAFLPYRPYSIKQNHATEKKKNAAGNYF